MWIDIGECSEALQQQRTVGDKSALCPSPEPLGRITFGLYGDAAPGTATRFVRLIKEGAYEGTTFHKVQVRSCSCETATMFSSCVMFLRLLPSPSQLEQHQPR